AIRSLAQHLEAHPDQGRLVLVLNETPRHGTLFAGEIEVEFRELVDLRAFASAHDLTVVRTQGGQTTFRMNIPDADFPQLLDRIRRDHRVNELYPVTFGKLEPG